MGRGWGAAILALGVVAAGCSATERGADPESSATLARPSSTPPPTVAPTLAPPTAPSTAPPTTPVPPATVPATCPTWAAAVVTGPLDPKLRETSGLAASRRTPGVLWAHNDSGNRPVVYASDETGRLLAELALDVPALDWEDLSIGPGPDGGPWIWVADVGDNLTLRPSVSLYRLPEPPVDPAGSNVPLTAPAVERITVTYPDGPRDVEALLVDPISGDALLVGKGVSADDTVPVYRLPADQLRDGARVVAEPVARIVGRSSRGNGPTAADVSADGTLVLVSNGREGLLWLRDPASSIGAVFSATPEAPCKLSPEGGEAVAFSLDGRRVWAVNEGEGARLRRIDRS